MSKSTPEQTTSDAKAAPATQSYFLPEYGVTVEATSVDDAVAQAKQQLTVKDGDANS